MHFRVPTGHILATFKTNVPAITKNKDGRSPPKKMHKITCKSAFLSKGHLSSVSGRNLPRKANLKNMLAPELPSLLLDMSFFLDDSKE